MGWCGRGICVGDCALFVTRPISAVCLGLALVLLLSPLVPRLGKKGEAIALEEVI